MNRTIPSSEAFGKSFLFKFPFMKHAFGTNKSMLNSAKVVVAGGSVSNTITGNHQKYSDIDFFFVGAEDDAHARVQSDYAILKQFNFWICSFQRALKQDGYYISDIQGDNYLLNFNVMVQSTTRTGNDDFVVKCQVIFKHSRSILALLQGFDLSSAKVAWDGTTLFYTSDAAEAYKNGYNVIPSVVKENLTRRLKKYYDRGFGFKIRMDTDQAINALTRFKLDVYDFSLVTRGQLRQVSHVTVKTKSMTIKDKPFHVGATSQDQSGDSYYFGGMRVGNRVIGTTNEIFFGAKAIHNLTKYNFVYTGDFVVKDTTESTYQQSKIDEPYYDIKFKTSVSLSTCFYSNLSCDQMKKELVDFLCRDSTIDFDAACSKKQDSIMYPVAIVDEVSKGKKWCQKKPIEFDIKTTLQHLPLPSEFGPATKSVDEWLFGYKNAKATLLSDKIIKETIEVDNSESEDNVRQQWTEELDISESSEEELPMPKKMNPETSDSDSDVKKKKIISKKKALMDSDNEKPKKKKTTKKAAQKCKTKKAETETDSNNEPKRRANGVGAKFTNSNIPIKDSTATKLSLRQELEAIFCKEFVQEIDINREFVKGQMSKLCYGLIESYPKPMDLHIQRSDKINIEIFEEFMKENPTYGKIVKKDDHTYRVEYC